LSFFALCNLFQYVIFVLDTVFDFLFCSLVISHHIRMANCMQCTERASDAVCVRAAVYGDQQNRPDRTYIYISLPLHWARFIAPPNGYAGFGCIQPPARPIDRPTDRRQASTIRSPEHVKSPAVINVSWQLATSNCSAVGGRMHTYIFECSQRRERPSPCSWDLYRPHARDRCLPERPPVPPRCAQRIRLNKNSISRAFRCDVTGQRHARCDVTIFLYSWTQFSNAFIINIYIYIYIYIYILWCYMQCP